MASDLPKQSKWIAQPPSAFDIVTAYYPEANPKGALNLRPCLVLDVLKGKETGAIACRVTYGTKNLRFVQRKRHDVIIQNHQHLNQMGLPYATRFNLDEDCVVLLPWDTEFFGCWRGYFHPKIGTLLEKYQKDYAFLMAMRQAEQQE